MNKYFLLAVSLLCILAGCTSENNENQRKNLRKRPVAFRKLKDYSLNLSLLSSRREFYAGDERATMIFSLKNTGLKPVTLHEWHTVEAANVNLYYHPGKMNVSNPQWEFSPTVNEKQKGLESYSPLTLNPDKNLAVIQIPVTFLKNVKNVPGKKTVYTIRAVLNLKSVTVESTPVEIWIK